MYSTVAARLVYSLLVITAGTMLDQPPDNRANEIPDAPGHSSWKAAPTLREVILLALVTGLVFVITVLCFHNYSSAVDGFGDSHSYVSVASAIRHWNFQGLEIKQFWGYPYAMAAFSLVTNASEQTSLLAISFISSFVSIALAYQLWGGWVAGFFAVLNFDWMQRSFLGGSEPLAVVLILGALLAVRRNRYLLASFLASASTVVRPLGICCLVAIVMVLLYRREFKKALLSIVIAGLTGMIYMWPLARYFRDPLATVHSYQNPGTPLFGIPFYAIVKGTILYPAPWTNLILSLGWIVLVLAGIATMFSERFRQYAKEHPVEILFAAPFLLLILSYNYPVFARSNFSRFAIPVLPLIFFSLFQRINKDRRILWALAASMPILAAASALGIRNVTNLLR